MSYTFSNQITCKQTQRRKIWATVEGMIKFRFQLNAQYFISIVILLYMFRALLRPSSGGLLHIYNIWFYVSLKLIYKI